MPKLLKTWLAIVAVAATSIAAPRDYLMYAGTFTKSGSAGIYGFRFSPKSKKLQPLGAVAKTSNPTWLAVHPGGHFLYAVNEDADGKVSAFLIDRASGKLTPVNQVSSHGASPCHLSFDREGRYLAVANYASGSIAVFPLQQDGGLQEASAVVQHTGSSIVKGRQDGPHAHAVVFSPDNRFLLAADLGADKIFVYRFDSQKGTLAPAAAVPVTPGSGVRHLVFHPNGRVLYSINEIASTVTGWFYEPQSGGLEEFQTVPTVPTGSSRTSAGEIVINRAGTMIYGSNRGMDSLALLVVDPVRFTLSNLEFTPLLGKTPRNFALDPTGAFMIVANQDSNTLSVFTVHPKTGQIQPVGRQVSVDSPTSVVFVE